MVHSDWSEAEANTLIEARKGEKGAMLPILHDLMERFGYIDAAAIPLIASALNISRADTIGVVGFYQDFRRAPVNGPVLKICRAESCQAAGCEDLVAHLEHRHGLVADSHAGRVIVETVYCLGHCAASPAAMLDGEPMARLTRESLDACLAELGR
ncbi:MAG TPA: NAD(P)H-dependent oxidoreductase subunit E [Roseiarcus sp.]|nr:NAD(P)H-dependent oxidoreductase subunit E [Roseiarcus sp.]